VDDGRVVGAPAAALVDGPAPGATEEPVTPGLAIGATVLDTGLEGVVVLTVATRALPPPHAPVATTNTRAVRIRALIS
jgi:hypothetical protein